MPARNALLADVVSPLVALRSVRAPPPMFIWAQVSIDYNSSIVIEW